MPRKGFFTASACLLLEHPVSLEAIEHCLTAFPVRGRTPTTDAWATGPTVAVALGDTPHGRLLIDVIASRWPDAMGDPRTDPLLFGAWSMGFFGPFAYPGNLERAVQQAWGWPEAATVVARHTAFVRLLATYAAGAELTDPLSPDSYDPLWELRYLTQVAVALCALPEALCYFNPNGESLCDRPTLERAWAHYSAGGPLPLHIWAKTRLFRLSDVVGWSLMDTVGIAQLDAAEHEACYRSDRCDPNDVALFLLNTAHLLVTARPTLTDGTTTDGPGGIWRAWGHDTSLMVPPRRVWRWFPEDGTEVPGTLRDARAPSPTKPQSRFSFRRNRSGG